MYIIFLLKSNLARLFYNVIYIKANGAKIMEHNAAIQRKIGVKREKE